MTHSFNDHGRRAFADSRAWFPELHARDHSAVLAHYTLGLLGEIGELDEAIFADHPDRSEVAAELADVVVYSCEIGYLTGLDIDASLTDPAPAGAPFRTVLVTMGRLANAVKKLNRLDHPSWCDWEACIVSVRPAVVALLSRSLLIAGTQCNGIDIDDAIEAKHEVLVGRWGVPVHADSCECGVCKGVW